MFLPGYPRELRTNFSKYTVDPGKLISGGPPKDGIPSIDAPEYISAGEANSWLRDKAIVQGLDIAGEQIAFPKGILAWHEIVNTVIAGIPLAVTYCPLCGTFISFERMVLASGREQVIEFGVSGLLYNSDLVMYDRLTESLWAQITGEAIVGDLMGQELIMVTNQVLSWQDWRDAYPGTRVLSRHTGYARNYDVFPYGNYEKRRRIIFPVENRDPRLFEKEMIYGIEVDGQYKAYPQKSIMDANEITDIVAGRSIRVIYKNGIVTFKDESTGRELVPVIAFWFAWAAFYPQTELYQTG